MFITLTIKDDTENVVVNADNIAYMINYVEGVVIYFISGKSVTVQESMDKIQQLIQEAGK